jgi:putative flippase GtrA
MRERPTSSWKDLLSRNRQFILYCAIGASGALLDFVLYALLVWMGVMHHQFANAIGYTSGTVWSFFLNARFNFRTRDWLTLRFLSFCSVALLGWAASASILYLTVDRLGWNKYLGKLATIAVVVLLQYNLNRLVSFRKSRPPRD